MKALKREIALHNDTLNLPELRDFMSLFGDDAGIDPGISGRIILAVDEAVSNIIEHAYAHVEDGKAEINVTLECTEEWIKVVIRDNGVNFDPNEVEIPDVEQHVREGRKSGLGIFLMRRIMDEVKYSFKANIENILEMVMYLKKPTQVKKD